MDSSVQFFVPAGFKENQKGDYHILFVCFFMWGLLSVVGERIPVSSIAGEWLISRVYAQRDRYPYSQGFLTDTTFVHKSCLNKHSLNLIEYLQNESVIKLRVILHKRLNHTVHWLDNTVVVGVHVGAVTSLLHHFWSSNKFARLKYLSLSIHMRLLE